MWRLEMEEGGDVIRADGGAGVSFMSTEVDVPLSRRRNWATVQQPRGFHSG